MERPLAARLGQENLGRGVRKWATAVRPQRRARLWTHGAANPGRPKKNALRKKTTARTDETSDCMSKIAIRTGYARTRGPGRLTIIEIENQCDFEVIEIAAGFRDKIEQIG